MTCDRVVIINKGKIAAVDTPENLLRSSRAARRSASKLRRRNVLCRSC